MNESSTLMAEAGGSFDTLTKSNHSKQVSKACTKYVFYVGTFGVPPPFWQNCFKTAQIFNNEEDIIEAVQTIDEKNFPSIYLGEGRGRRLFRRMVGFGCTMFVCFWMHLYHVRPF